MKRQPHVLVLRFSALGDVAILAPVLKERMAFNPDVKFSVAAPAMLRPLFSDIPKLNFIPVDKKKGNWRIFLELRKCHPTEIADVHTVIRTIIIDILFILLCGVRVHILHKQHIKRALLIRKQNKVLRPLSSSWQLYDYVLRQCRLVGRALPYSYIVTKPSPDGIRRVGIAPFANFIGKSWPVEYMKSVVERLSREPDLEVFLFGGKKEQPILEEWAHEFDHTLSMAGSNDFAGELDTIRKLNVMVSMDSANMHFASCVDVPVVSIWGATHPYNGFYGWRQNPDNAVQVDMQCRPCSVYGNAKCYKGTYECMYKITPEMVLDKIYKVIS